MMIKVTMFDNPYGITSLTCEPGFKTNDDFHIGENLTLQVVGITREVTEGDTR
jgi:hypothetical protein